MKILSGLYKWLRQHITLLHLNHHLTGHHAECQRLPGKVTLRRPVSCQIQLTLFHARSLGNQTDDAGNILGNVLGGQGGKGNVSPQLPGINRGEYRMFENEVRKYINKNGAVDIDWTFIYANAGRRPTEIVYNVTQNGKTVLYSTFGN